MRTMLSPYGHPAPRLARARHGMGLPSLPACPRQHRPGCPAGTHRWIRPDAGARVGGASGSHARGGVGSWAARWQDWTVGVLAAVNAVGSVRDPQTGAWVAGGPPMVDTRGDVGRWRGQTTLVVVATDAPLVQGELRVLAKMASAGMARTLFPAFTPFDGDVVFAVSTGTPQSVDPLVLAAVGDLAATCVERAIVRAVRPGADSRAGAS